MDPIEYVDNINLYSYVANNPVNWIDPWGLCKKGAPGGVFPKGQWPPPPETTPEPPKAGQKPKPNISKDPTPKDPTPNEPTTTQTPQIDIGGKFITAGVGIVFIGGLTFVSAPNPATAFVGIGLVFTGAVAATVGATIKVIEIIRSRRRR